NKKYYWLKLKEDFFDEDTISWIEEQDNGKEYCLFYLKLCLKSLHNNGVLIRTVGEKLIPYDPKKLSEITRTDVDTVMVAMDLFSKIGLIEKLENGEIYLKQLSEMVGSETSKAILMRRKRALDKMGNNVTKALPKCDPEIEIEIDKEIDKEIEIDKELNASQSNELFEKFWDIYDLKKGKHRSQLAWDKLKQDDIKAIFDTIDLYIKYSKTDYADKKDQRTSRKYPLTYLNSRGWEDAPDIPKSEGQLSRVFNLLEKNRLEQEAKNAKA
ncbi:MAG TPA: phage replisome organizer N-terminal domain-containing protein, partial [Anaerolineae bacterium]|nr:phage replisome organizer N-terminal domain-containing protein [Anaerolineae bacterium]